MAVRESQPAMRDSRLAYNQPAGCVCMHCNLRVRSSSYSYFEIRVYFHPYYNMTLGFKSLGCRGTILIMVPTLVFEKVFIYSVYLRICLCCNHKPLAFDMQVGHCISWILDCVVL
jgi:hypothetical protein